MYNSDPLHDLDPTEHEAFNSIILNLHPKKSNTTEFPFLFLKKMIFNVACICASLNLHGK